MRYEPLYGLQKPFDNGPADSTAYGLFLDEYIYYKMDKTSVYFFDIDNQWSRIDDDAPIIPFLAMRRIIAEPKRWTVEDQKAGRLPDVGCRVVFCHKLNTNWRTGEIKYIDNQVAVIKADDIDRPFVYEFDRVEFKPLETPAEKAQRLEDEFVNNVSKEASRRMTETDLGFYTDGIRAAYRKLKITEVE